MLRHKRMVHLSLYNFRRYMYFSDGANFHTTDCLSLRRNATSRKVYPEIKPSLEENGVAGNFEPQPVTKTFNNFYGIESEEGVIHISADKNSIKPSQDSFIHKFTSKQMSERFKNTCFGKVRLDSENKVIIHGQYEENTSISEISEIDKAIRLKKFAIDDSASNTSPSVEQTSLPTVESNDINSKFDASLQLKKVKNPSDYQQNILQFDVAEEHKHGTANDISLIDESFFPEKLLKEEQSITTDFSNESVNIYELDSKKVNNDKDVKFSISNDNLDVGNVKRCDSSELENHLLPEEKSSFFDELVFGSKLENKNFEAKEKSTYGMTSEAAKNNELLQTASFSNKNEKVNFIDDYYFNDRLVNGPTEEDSKYIIEDISSPETTSTDNVAKNARSHGIENKKIICQSKTEFKVKNLESNKNKLSSYGLETQFLDKMSNEPELNSDNTNKFPYHEAVNKQLTMSTPRSMPISSFTEGLPSDRVLHQSTSQNTKVPENNEILSRKVANDQKRIEDDQPETAFDFVKKLRGEKAPTYHEKISGFSGAPREKLDSKGFRILKYQVPELKYFTKDEMLELLVKNVLYSDDDVIVLNKPYNLVMHESKTTKEACLSKYLDDLAGELDKKSKKPKLLTVHRLDKETTGCLLLARNDTSAQYLKSLFANRKIVKTYWIVTIKVPDTLQGIIDIPIAEGLVDNRTRMVLSPDLPKDIPYRNHSKRGENAVTQYSVISESGNAALVEVKPETGIKHQIRVHFGLGLGCPILGDHKYTYSDKLVPQKLQTDLLQKLSIRQSKVRYVPMHIYARSIFIPQYSEERNLFVMAPMPIHMSKNLQRLKFKKK